MKQTEAEMLYSIAIVKARLKTKAEKVKELEPANQKEAEEEEARPPL